ncbi:MAG: hypothetical protein IIB38_11055 [Candidatus Hydrogenedentes bacterium]|nr:hypothetical protein [Candidatus Hydrogenedentota bacterium]
MKIGREIRHHLILSRVNVAALFGIAIVISLVALPYLHADYGATLTDTGLTFGHVGT